MSPLSISIETKRQLNHKQSSIMLLLNSEKNILLLK